MLLFYKQKLILRDPSFGGVCGGFYYDIYSCANSRYFGWKN
jgi:hypothetical protein